MDGRASFDPQEQGVSSRVVFLLLILLFLVFTPWRLSSLSVAMAGFPDKRLASTHDPKLVPGQYYAFSKTHLDASTHKYVLQLQDPSGELLPVSCSHVFGTIAAATSAGEMLRNLLIEELKSSPFPAFFFETPPYTSRSLATAHFEFVLIMAQGFARRRADSSDFDDYILKYQGSTEIVVFDNLSRDARLVVPASATPAVPADTYKDIASFARGAPEAQVHALWAKVGEVALELAGDEHRWLSTHGGGVPWLHVRFDLRPKYYNHKKYKNY